MTMPNVINIAFILLALIGDISGFSALGCTYRALHSEVDFDEALSLNRACDRLVAEWLSIPVSSVENRAHITSVVLGVAGQNSSRREAWTRLRALSAKAPESLKVLFDEEKETMAIIYEGKPGRIEMLFYLRFTDDKLADIDTVTVVRYSESEG